MAFQGAVVIKTLWAVAGALRESWGQVGESTRLDIERLLRTQGLELARADDFGFPYRAAGILAALWEMRGRLPGTVVSLLQEGARGQSAGAPPMPERVDADSREALLQRLLGVVDFRVFRRADRLAAEVSRYVADHLERLTEVETQHWRAMDGELRHGGPSEIYLQGVERLLGDRIESVKRMLERGKGWEPDRLRDATPLRSGAVRAAGTETGEVHRFANAHFPAALLLTQKHVPLVIHIARRYVGGAGNVSEADARLLLRPGELTVIVNAEDFAIAEVIGGRPVPAVPNARSLAVELERDCEPLIFFVDPQSAGRKRISIALYQFDRQLAALGLETNVVAEPGVFALPQAAIEPVQLVSPGPQAMPPALELRVTLSHDQRTLSYMLHSPAGGDYTFKAAGQTALQCDPEELLGRTLGRLSDLAGVSALERSPEQAARTIQELRDIGANLYTDLFSPEFKVEYRTIRLRYSGRSVMITSDEPWIPWELVRPVEVDAAGRVLYDDPPLCEMFHLSRWLAGRGAPDTVAVRNAVLVLPPSNLNAAHAEEAFFAELHRQCWDIRVESPLSTLSGVEEKFRAGSVHLIHFACHGNFDSSDADESKLRLTDGYLRPSQIIGDKQAGLRKAKPIVFLNTCHSGRVGFAMTRLGGWAQRFLDSGATAFIGSLWEISDELAALFASALYERLLGCQGRTAIPFAQAFHEARMVIKQVDPANPTWLAFVIYADPLGRVRLGQGA